MKVKLLLLSFFAVVFASCVKKELEHAKEAVSKEISQDGTEDFSVIAIGNEALKKIDFQFFDESLVIEQTSTQTNFQTRTQAVSIPNEGMDDLEKILDSDSYSLLLELMSISSYMYEAGNYISSSVMIDGVAYTTSSFGGNLSDLPQDYRAAEFESFYKTRCQTTSTDSKAARKGVEACLEEAGCSAETLIRCTGIPDIGGGPDITTCTGGC